MAEGFEPTHGRINSAVPYQLGYATMKPQEEMQGRGDTEKSLSPHALSPHPRIRHMEAMKGVEPLSFGLQDRRSVIQLSYIAMRIGGLGGIQTLAGSLQDITSPEYLSFVICGCELPLFAQYAAGASE